MRIVCLIGLLLGLSACANYREIVFIYYPNAPRNQTFPPPSEFAAEAQRECAKYGMVAIHDWESVADWQRVRSSWLCVPH
jgi:hypothetical protein